MIGRALITISAVIVAGIASATEGADAMLRSIKASLDGMGRYSVQFALDVNHGQMGGNYCIEGGNFYMKVGNMEIYVRNGVRYEVDLEKKEVSIDNAGSVKDDLISNPTLDFSSFLEKYDSQSARWSGGDMVVLRSKREQRDGNIIRIYISDASHLPSRIDYVVRNGEIRIVIVKIAKAASPLPVFVPERYASFETFDYR